MKVLNILVVDDNRSAADALARVLTKKGDNVRAVYDGQTAIDSIQSSPPDIVLTDLRMEPIDGIEVLRAARDQRPPVEVIVFTAYGAVDVAVKAMQFGARDFLTKPVTVDQLSARLDEYRREFGNDDDPPTDTEEVPRPDVTFVANSPKAASMLEVVKRAATVPSPVWIEGELGSGRGYTAATVHHYAGQGGELHVRNPARETPWPSSGTVLLPNVDNMPQDLQQALYLQLQTLPEGVRVIATAGPDSRRRVTEGTLRSDLYYTLAVIVVSVPALRERPDDIPELLEQALQRYSRRYKRPCPRVEPATRAKLQRHSWPGNVRELCNLAERAVVLGNDRFDLEILESSPPGLPTLEPGFSLSSYLESVEKQLLTEALRRTGGDRTKAGQLLGVERNTLRYKLNKYGLL